MCVLRFCTRHKQTHQLSLVSDYVFKDVVYDGQPDKMAVTSPAEQRA